MRISVYDALSRLTPGYVLLILVMALGCFSSTQTNIAVASITTFENKTNQPISGFENIGDGGILPLLP